MTLAELMIEYRRRADVADKVNRGVIGYYTTESRRDAGIRARVWIEASDLLEKALNELQTLKGT